MSLEANEKVNHDEKNNLEIDATLAEEAKKFAEDLERTIDKSDNSEILDEDLSKQLSKYIDQLEDDSDSGSRDDDSDADPSLGIDFLKKLLNSNDKSSKDVETLKKKDTTVEEDLKKLTNKILKRHIVPGLKNFLNTLSEE